QLERTILESTGGSDKEEWRNKLPVKYLGWAGVIFGSILFYGACQPGPMRPIRVFGASWFFLAYLPISNLIDLNATVAEHWLYLPSVGFLIFLVGCALDLPLRWRRAIVAFACAAIFALGARSAVRSSDWISNETF